MRSTLLTLSHRRSLGRLATRTPITRPMVRRFICAETLEEALPAIRRLHDEGMRTTVDVLGESVSEEADARAAAARYVAVLDALAGGEPGPQRLAQAHPDGPRHRSRPGARDHRRHRRQGGRARRLRAHRHGGPHHHGQHAGPVAGRPADDLAGRRRGRGAGDPVGAPAQRRRHRGDHRRGRPGPAVQGCLQGARERRLPGQGGRGRGLRAADAAPDARRPLPGDRHPRREADQARGRRSRRPRGSRKDAFEFQMLYGIRRDIQEQLVGAGWTRPHLRPVRLASGTRTSCAAWRSDRRTSSFILRNLWRERGRG